MINKKFDPRTIFLSTLFLTISLIIMNNIIQTLFCFIAILIHIILVGVKVKNLIKIFFASIWLLLSIILINYFFINKDISIFEDFCLKKWNGYHYHRKAIENLLYVFNNIIFYICDTFYKIII